MTVGAFSALGSATACSKLKASVEGAAASASASASAAPAAESTGAASASASASAAAAATATATATHGGKAGAHLQNGEKKVDLDTNADGGKLTLHNDAGTGSLQYGSSSGMTLRGAGGKTLTIPAVNTK